MFYNMINVSLYIVKRYNEEAGASIWLNKYFKQDLFSKKYLTITRTLQIGRVIGSHNTG